MKNQFRSQSGRIRSLRYRLKLGLLGSAALLLSACVTHYYPSSSGIYNIAPPQRDYVAVTAHVPAPQASVTYFVDSAYYPWWSLDYFYLGSGFGYRYGYRGYSVGVYAGPRWGYGWPYYGWPAYGWGSPWYYPPFYTAWYPSHYWRPYYHPRHHYWAHQYQQRPPYGHRPVNVGYGRPVNGRQAAPSPRLRGSPNEEWPAATGAAVRPVAGGTAGGRLGGSMAPVAPSAAARPVAGAFRAPAPSTAERPRVVSQSPGFNSGGSVGGALSPARAPSKDYNTRTIRAPVYRPPLNSTAQNQSVPVRPVPAAPQPYSPVRAAPAPASARSPAGMARPQPVGKMPSGGSVAPAVQRPGLPPAAAVPRSMPAPQARPAMPAPRSLQRPPSMPKAVSPPPSRPSPRPAAPRVSRPPSAERPG